MRVSNLTTAELWGVSQETVTKAAVKAHNNIIVFFQIGIKLMRKVNRELYAHNSILQLEDMGMNGAIMERSKTIDFYEKRIADITGTGRTAKLVLVSTLEADPATWAGKIVKTVVDDDGNIGEFQVLDDRLFALSFRSLRSGEVFLFPNDTLVEPI